ncbi:5960_t:CDS:2, partial [Dentiscutata heterogama]
MSFFEKRCEFCRMMKKTDEFLKLTNECVHNNTVCLDCANAKLLQLDYCADFICFISGCGKKMTLANILEITKTKSFSDPTRYDKLYFNRAAAETEGFQWCRNDIYPQMECTSCKRMTCCKHKIPWHYGQKCDQYDKNRYCSGCGFPFQPTNDGNTCNIVNCPFNGCNQIICR